MKASAIKRYLQCIAALPFLPFWHLQKKIKRDENLWLFGSSNNSTDSDNGYTFFKYVNENYKDVRTIWVTQQKSVYEKIKAEGYLNVAMSNSKKGRRACLHAGLCFISIGPTETNKRYINGIKQIVLWHSMPIKVIGNDFEALLQKNRSKQETRLLSFEKFCMPYLHNMKPACFFSTSEFFTPIITSAFGLSPDKICPLGQPKNDAFFYDATEDLITQINEKFDHPLKIVYMPTFRDNLRNSGKQFNAFDGFGFDKERFSEMLEKENVVFLFKCHNHDGFVQVDNISNRFILLTPDKYNDPYTLLKDIDILMTDYSSVYFDFLLTKKPIILAPFDLEKYQAQRPFYFDYSKNIEGCVVNNWNEFIEAIEGHKYLNPSDEVCRKFNKFQDGQSCERILEYVKDHFVNPSNKSQKHT
ncbi:MAG: CDP-glycerol glycerophosphotransferase family protein [Bacteroidales bacterium]|nr:CDP-glycerol glycerophosphotransferase family protein [Bacteroidales bacterium]